VQEAAHEDEDGTDDRHADQDLPHIAVPIAFGANAHQ
jgi:hypothetical protein